MTKSPLSRALLVAGVLAAAGATAHATPAVVGSTLLPQTTYSTYTYTYPAAVTTYSYPAGVYAVPAAPGLYSYATAPGVTYYQGWDLNRGSATATTNVPDRAGEITTMTNGVPNVSTDNFPRHNGYVVGQAISGPYYDHRGNQVYLYR
jgi:hypothetical protein